MSKPHVAVASLGGTITMTSDTIGAGVTPTMDADALLAAVPGLSSRASLEAVTLATLPSASVGYEECKAALAFAREAVDRGASGVVVVQGTDTLEETAYLLDLWWDLPQPLVVTGAMRAPQQAGSDGPANLLAAVTTAGDERSRNQGVLVVMNDEIHAASRVSKCDSLAVNAFQSPTFGPLGRLVEGHPRYGNRTPRPTPLGLLTAADLPMERSPRVALLPTHLGDEGELLELVLEARYDGVVLSTLGVGHVSSHLANVVSTATKQLPVIFGTRTGAGTTLLDSYGFPGSESDLIAKGAIPAGWLTPVKARLLLWALLSRERSLEEIKTAFHDRGSILWDGDASE